MTIYMKTKSMEKQGDFLYIYDTEERSLNKSMRILNKRKEAAKAQEGLQLRLMSKNFIAPNSDVYAIDAYRYLFFTYALTREMGVRGEVEVAKSLKEAQRLADEMDKAAKR